MSYKCYTNLPLYTVLQLIEEVYMQYVKMKIHGCLHGIIQSTLYMYLLQIQYYNLKTNLSQNLDSEYLDFYMICLNINC